MQDVLANIDWSPLINAVLAVVGTLASAVLVQLLRKYGIELKVEQQNAIDSALRFGALKAEELGATAKKLGTTMSSAAKRDIALDAASKLVPKVSPLTLADRLEAVLPTTGVGAAADAAGKAAAEPTK